MDTILPIGIVFGLGVIVRLACHRKPDMDNYFGFSVLVAIIATVIWVVD